MSEPCLTIGRDDRDDEGNLRPDQLAEVRRVLHDRGFVLLPSDTAYSMAAWLRSVQMRERLNAVLGRDDYEPISVAFPSVTAVQDWTTQNRLADQLLARFAPGPITVVRSAARRIPVEFTKQILSSSNHTIGVRITESAVERQVAGVGQSPITTVPVRRLTAEGPRKPVVTSFSEAVGIIRERTEEIGDVLWCAIEGEIRYSHASTVVEVLGEGGNYTFRREDGPFLEEIRAYLASGGDDGKTAEVRPPGG